MYWLNIFAALFSCCYCIYSYNTLPLGYELLFLLPLTYLFTVFILRRSLLVNDKKYMVLAFVGFNFIRYVLIPLFIAFTGVCEQNYTLSTSEYERNIALYASIYELLITSVFVLFCSDYFSRKTRNIKSKTSLNFVGSKFVYALYGIIALLLYYLYLRDLNIVHFIIIPVGFGERLNETGTSQNILLVVFRYCVIFFYLLCFNYFVHKDASNRYYYIAVLFISLLFCSIIPGERRLLVIYNVFTVLVLLYKFFPKFRRVSTIILLTVGGIVVLGMSLYKMNGGFMLDSYETIANNVSFSFGELSSNLIADFQGIGCIAHNIQYVLNTGEYHRNLSDLLYDIGRSFVGLNFLLKDYNLTTSVNYNQLTFNFKQDSGFLFSSTAYGFLYFGFIFMPVIMMFNLCCSQFFEYKIKTAKYMETYYFGLYLFIRSIFVMAMNTTSIVMAFSEMFIGFGTLAIFSFLVKRIKYNKNV